MTDEEIRAHTDELVAELTAEHARIKRKRDAAEQMLQALKSVITVAKLAHIAWDTDNDARVGKILIALSGGCPGYLREIDEIHAAIRAAEGGD